MGLSAVLSQRTWASPRSDAVADALAALVLAHAPAPVAARGDLGVPAAFIWAHPSTVAKLREGGARPGGSVDEVLVPMFGADGGALQVSVRGRADCRADELQLVDAAAAFRWGPAAEPVGREILPPPHLGPAVSKVYRMLRLQGLEPEDALRCSRVVVEPAAC